MADGWDISQEPLIEASNKKLDIVDGHAVKAPADYQNPDELYNSLIARIQKYHPSADISMVEKAYCIAKNAHEGQKRKSGEAYIIHPLWVGIILAQLEMDKETITAGILHDVVEDTVMTYDEIKEEFGDQFLLDANYVVFFRGEINKEGMKKLFSGEKDSSKEQPKD